MNAVEGRGFRELRRQMDFAERFASSIVDGRECLECWAVIEAGALGGGIDLLLRSVMRKLGPEPVEVECLGWALCVCADAG